MHCSLVAVVVGRIWMMRILWCCFFLFLLLLNVLLHIGVRKGHCIPRWYARFWRVEAIVIHIIIMPLIVYVLCVFFFGQIARLLFPENRICKREWRWQRLEVWVNYFVGNAFLFSCSIAALSNGLYTLTPLLYLAFLSLLLAEDEEQLRALFAMRQKRNANECDIL